MKGAPPPAELPIIRIFISSPSDVQMERRAVAAAVTKLGKAPHIEKRAVLQAVWYDDPERQVPLAYNRPMQESVNQSQPKPSECDIVIGILWSRMGKPLNEPRKADGSQYLSGTEWEIEDAIRAGKDLLIYKRTGPLAVDPAVMLDDVKREEFQTQLSRLNAFVERLRNATPGASSPIQEYPGLEEFRDTIGQHLAHHVEQLLEGGGGGGGGGGGHIHPVDQERLAALKTEYLDMLLNETATIQLPILAPSGRPIIAALSDLRIDLPLFVNHDHKKLDDQEDAIYGGIPPVEVNDRFRLSHADSLMVDRADRFDDDCRECSIGQRLDGGMRAVVIGDPGSGKSTLLKWLCHRYASSSRGRTVQQKDGLPDSAWFPIMIACREFREDAIPETLSDLLQTHLRNHQFSPEAAEHLANDLERLLAAGQAMLLIDGLDEIPNIGNRERFSDCLMTIANRFGGAPIIVSSRVVGFEALVDRMAARFDYLVIGPLDRAAKTTFVELWGRLCKLHEVSVFNLARQIVQSRVTAKITDNVLLLAIVVQLHAADGTLPARRVDLFRRAVDIILRRQHGGVELTRNEVVPHLEYLAYKMRIGGVQRLSDAKVIEIFSELRDREPEETELRRRSPQALLEACIGSVGLLNVAGQEVDRRGYDRQLVQFFHQSFQEYFAGQAILFGRGNVSGAAESIDAIRKMLIDVDVTQSEFSVFDRYRGNETVFAERWQEVMRLLLADLPEGDADVAFDALLPTPEMPQSEARARAIFALQCLADEPALSDGTTARLYQALLGSVLEYDGFNLVLNTRMDQAIYSTAQSRFGPGMKRAFVNAFISGRDGKRADASKLVTTALRFLEPLDDLDAEEIVQRMQRKMATEDPVERCEAMLRMVDLFYLHAQGRKPPVWPEDIAVQRNMFELVASGLESDEGTRAAALWALIWLCRGKLRTEVSVKLPLPRTVQQRVRAILADPDVEAFSRTRCLEALTCVENYMPPICQSDWVYDLAVIADGGTARRNLRDFTVVGKTPIDDLVLARSAVMDLGASGTLALGALGTFSADMASNLIRVCTTAAYTEDERFEAMLYLALIRTKEAVEVLVRCADTDDTNGTEDDFFYTRGLFSLLFLDDVDILAEQIRKKLPHSDIRAYAYGMAGSADPRGRAMLIAMSNDDDQTIRAAAMAALDNEKLKPVPEAPE